MTGKEIIKELSENGYTLTKVADELGIGNTTIGRVINKGRASKRIQNKICEILNKSYETVWNKPEYEKISSRAMSKSEILYRLGEKKITETAIADILGVSQSAVSQVIKGTQTSKKIQSYICKIIGFSWNDVWSKT
jgi:predicted transcriptional regulator